MKVRTAVSQFELASLKARGVDLVTPDGERVEGVELDMLLSSSPSPEEVEEAIRLLGLGVAAWLLEVGKSGCRFRVVVWETRKA